jgi:hypothetical protein
MKMCIYMIIMKENIRQQGALFVALWMDGGGGFISMDR